MNWLKTINLAFLLFPVMLAKSKDSLGIPKCDQFEQVHDSASFNYAVWNLEKVLSQPSYSGLY